MEQTMRGVGVQSKKENLEELSCDFKSNGEYLKRLPDECCLFDTCMKSRGLSDCQHIHPEYIFTKEMLFKAKIGEELNSSFEKQKMNPQKKVLKLKLNVQTTHKDEFRECLKINMRKTTEQNEKVRASQIELSRKFCNISDIKQEDSQILSQVRSGISSRKSCILDTTKTSNKQSHTFIFSQLFDSEQEITLLSHKRGDLLRYHNSQTTNTPLSNKPIIIARCIFKAKVITIAKQSTSFIFVLQNNDRKLNLYSLTNERRWLLNSVIASNVADFEIIDRTEQKRLYLLIFLGTSLSIMQYKYQAKKQALSLVSQQQSFTPLHHDTGNSRVTIEMQEHLQQFIIHQFFRNTLRYQVFSMEDPSRIEATNQIFQTSIDDNYDIQGILEGENESPISPMFLKIVRTRKSNYIAVGLSHSICLIYKSDLTSYKVIRFWQRDLLDVSEEFKPRQNRYLLFMLKQTVLLFEITKHACVPIITLQMNAKCLAISPSRFSQYVNLITKDNQGKVAIKKIKGSSMKK